MERLRVAVVFGGRSVEHDVSVITAHQVMAALGARHDVVPVYVDRNGRWFAGAALNDLAVYRDRTWPDVGMRAHLSPAAGTGGLVIEGSRWKGPRVETVDVVVPAIHGTFGEDGTLQGLLELAALPYTGSGVVASAVGMDKVAMKAVLRDAGLPTVPHVVVTRPEEGSQPEIGPGVPLPAFVKPSRLGSSVGIGRADDDDGLRAALEVAFRYDETVLVEPAMDGCSEVNCSVLGGPGHSERASVCEQPVAWAEFLTFSDKYLRGGKGAGTKGMAGQTRRIPAPIPDEMTKQVQENAIAAFRAVGAAGVARVDSWVREETGETWVMEINTIPGSFSFYLWEETGVMFADLMDELLEIALERHRRRQDLVFTFESPILEGPRAGKTGA